MPIVSNSKSSTAHGRICDLVVRRAIFFSLVSPANVLCTWQGALALLVLSKHHVFIVLFAVFNFYLFRLNQLNYGFNSIFEFTFALLRPRFDLAAWIMARSNVHYHVIINGSASTNNRAKTHTIQPTIFTLFIYELCVAQRRFDDADENKSARSDIVICTKRETKMFDRNIQPNSATPLHCAHRELQ